MTRVTFQSVHVLIFGSYTKLHNKEIERINLGRRTCASSVQKIDP